MARASSRLTAKIRPSLREGEERRQPPVDESDPARLKLVGVCRLRDADPAAWAARRGVTEEEARAEIFQKWEKACSDYVLQNLGLAVTYARELSPRHVPEKDLVHGCAYGLLRAIREFDVDRAGKFSTFAVWKMRHEAGMVIHRQEGAIVPVPGQLRDDKRAVDEEHRRLSALLGCPPDDERLLSALREREAEDAADSRREGKKPRPERWATAGEDQVRDVRETYIGPSHKVLDPRLPLTGGGPPEGAMDVRRAFSRLDPLLRAVFADEHGIDLPGVDFSLVPSCPVAREIALDLAAGRLRAFLSRR